MNYKLIIGWLYPELMSTYGDRGNIIVLQKRCEWRGINVEVKKMDIGFNPNQLKQCDLLFMGGAQDRQQQIVAKDLIRKKDVLQNMIEDNTPGLYVCGAYQFLGKYYKDANDTIIDGLRILDIYTKNPGPNYKRLIGNIATKISILNFPPDFVFPIESGWRADQFSTVTLVGFENHGGRTYLGKNIKPLATTIKGFGNNAVDKTEGAIYKNSFGTYLHGPILPKNPIFADMLIKLALEKKYKKKVDLSSLEDTVENLARKTIANRLHIEI